jgi:hypothetical protein
MKKAALWPRLRTCAALKQRIRLVCYISMRLVLATEEVPSIAALHLPGPAALHLPWSEKLLCSYQTRTNVTSMLEL